MPVTIDKLLGKPLSHTHHSSDIIQDSNGSSGTDNTSTVTVSTDTTLGTISTVLVNAAAGVITISLPAAAAKANSIFRIKKIDSSSNVVIVDPNGTELIDGDTSCTIAFQYSTLDIVSNGTSWYII